MGATTDIHEIRNILYLRIRHATGRQRFTYRDEGPQVNNSHSRLADHGPAAGWAMCSAGDRQVPPTSPMTM